MIDLEEAAQRLGLSVSTVRRLVRDGELTAYRIGKQIRLRPEEVDAFVNANAIRVQPAARRESESDE